MEYNFDEINQQIANIQSSNAADKTTRVARLIILLIKIEKELKTVEQTLEKLWNQAYRQNNDNLKVQCREKINTVQRLQAKISKARLNLNYFFL